ncbi:MAG: ABC transporter ATP-binding protein [Alphaproteobacteria bacterium]|nr:ABC transporter ATP-binding protein [Alphaproteobacteria bacterium]
MIESAPALQIADLRFNYRHGDDVLAIARFDVRAGERLFLRGASGSGKSTLLGLIAGILSPQAGRIEVLGEDLTTMGAAKRDAFRAARLGVIFQMFNLLPYLPVGRNITLPCRFSPERARNAADAGGADAEARRLLDRLGLDPAEFWLKRSSALSVGQQQRVAAARALIGRPGLILADEPTSALDADSRDAFIDLLKEECAASGAALIFVSHDSSLADHFDRALDLSDLNTASVTA